MGSIERRLEQLEEERGLTRRELSEEGKKERWLETARHRRRRFELDDWEPYGKVRDKIGALRLQGMLGRTTEELRNQLLAWRPPFDENAIEREIARFIYAREEGTENMVCPPQWRESLEAADRVRELFAAVPVEVLARWAAMLHEKKGEAREEVAQKIATEGASVFGITDELMRKALGPDVDEITDEERRRRLREILADNYFTERGWRVQQEIDRLLKERNQP